MKLIKFLDRKGTVLASDPLNQLILRNLVMSEHSTSELSVTLNQPILKLWRRMQKLLKANLVELSRVEKVGNLDKKMYRATATRYVPQQYFDFVPKDPNLREAFKIYSNIQNKIMTKISAFAEIPKDANPVDFAMYASMHAFTQICTEPTTHAKLEVLDEKLAKFQRQNKH